MRHISLALALLASACGGDSEPNYHLANESEGPPPDMTEAAQRTENLSVSPERVNAIHQGQAEDWRNASQAEKLAVANTWALRFTEVSGVTLRDSERALFATQMKTCVDRASAEPRTRSESVATLGALCMMLLTENR